MELRNGKVKTMHGTPWVAKSTKYTYYFNGVKYKLTSNELTHILYLKREAAKRESAKFSAIGEEKTLYICLKAEHEALKKALAAIGNQK